MSSAFIHQALRACLVVLVCAGAGFALARLAPPHSRRILLLASPVVGAAGVVVLGHWIGLVLPMRVGAWLIVGAVVLAVSVALVRERATVAPDARAWALGLLLSAVALPGVLATWDAHRHAEVAGLAFPTPNHDAYYFDATADWFLDHTIFEVPRVGVDIVQDESPAVSVVRQYEGHRRWGEQTLQSLPAAIFGGRVSEHWNVMSSIWLLFVPGALVLLASVIHVTRPAVVAAISGFAITSLGSVLYSVHNQNSPLILGLPLAVAAVALVADLLTRDGRPAVGDYVLTGVVVGGWLGTYVELAAVATPLLVGLVVAAPMHVPWRQLLVRLWRCAVGVLAIAPVIVFNVVSGVSALAAAAAVWPDRYGDAAMSTILGRLVGLVPLDPVPLAEPGWFRPVLVTVLLGWIALVVVVICWRPRVAIVLGVLTAVTGAYWLWTGRGDAHYVANRVVLMWSFVAFALVLLAAVDWMIASARVALPAVGLFLVVSVLGGARVAVEVGDAFLPHRSTTAGDEAASAWVIGRQRAGGTTAVATPNYVDQLVLMDLLRDEPAVNWLGMFTDYATTPYHIGSSPTPLLLTAASAIGVAEDDVVSANEQWELVRLSPGAVVVTGDPDIATITDNAMTFVGEPSPRVNVTFGSPCATWVVDAALSPGSPRSEVSLTEGPDLNIAATQSVELTDDFRPVELNVASWADVVRINLPPGVGGVTIANPRCSTS